MTEPTEEMLYAGIRAWQRNAGRAPLDCVREIWRAMKALEPNPLTQKPQVQQIVEEANNAK